MAAQGAGSFLWVADSRMVDVQCTGGGGALPSGGGGDDPAAVQGVSDVSETARQMNETLAARVLDTGR